MLAVEGLKKHYPAGSGLLRRSTALLKAVDGVSFGVGRGETLALVGESGCGKTTTAKLVLLLDEPSGGTIRFRDEDVVAGNGAVRARYRRAVQSVFQDPYSSLDPRMRIGASVGEPLWAAGTASQTELRARVEEVLEKVGLSPKAAQRFPHEFSGGQRQRIALARALAVRPALIVLDEPVSALDVSIRAQMMNLLKDLQEELGVSFLLIAHDLATVRYMCHRVAIMYLGRIVEEGPGEELFAQPAHPYTRALLSAALPSHPDIKRDEIRIPGEVPSPLNPPAGCHFHPRCPQAIEACRQSEPQSKPISQQHQVACHLY